MKTLALLLLCGMAVGQEPKHAKDVMYDCMDGHTLENDEWQKVYSKDLGRVCFESSRRSFRLSGSSKPEPMDVPAVEHYKLGGGSEMKWWTCTDTRRVLLTSQDGKNHCVLFPKEKP